MSSKCLRILLVDDHHLFRKALIRLIASFSFPSQIFEASNGKEAMEFLANSPVDLILLDIQMPEMGGIETLKQIRAQGNKVKVITLSQFDEESLIVHLLQLGANGILLKASDPSELEKAIVMVTTQGHYYTNLVLKALENNLSDESKRHTLVISPREFQVLVLLKDGQSNKEVAKKLGLSLRTVESYRKNLIKKTRSRNTVDLIGLAYRTGMFS